MSRIVCVVGTRPEVIKMAPVILALKETDWAQVRVVATAQHRGLLDQALADFGIVPDLDLDLMQDNQTLAGLTARLICRIDEVLDAEKPEFVLAQGDTTTVMATGLCCFYRGVPFGHIEAGLRTHQRRLPFPEEMNRVFADYLSSLHFAPTETACRHLLAEGVLDSSIILTGNTVIDALLYQVALSSPEDMIDPARRLILVTAHRRENFGDSMISICTAVATLAERYADVEFLFPVHPNPNVGLIVRRMLGGNPRITLCEPLNYARFVAALAQSYLVLTDSGGVQEEAPALGKPVLVMRTETERPEAVQAGVAKLVGVESAKIIAEVSKLLDDPVAYRAMARGVSPYGDGKAAARIVASLARRMGHVADSRFESPFSPLSALVHEIGAE